MVLPGLTQAGTSAVWGRPYAILAGCFGTAVPLWELGEKRAWRPVCMCLALAVGMLMHFYAGNSPAKSDGQNVGAGEVFCGMH